MYSNSILRSRSYRPHKKLGLWVKPEGGIVKVIIKKNSWGIAEVKTVLEKHKDVNHFILFGKKISYPAMKLTHLQTHIHVEFLEWNFMNILKHPDVPVYRKVRDTGKYQSLYGPPARYPKLIANKDPVCKVLGMRKGEIWTAGEDITGVGRVETPRFII
jgi:hypothetical protein